MLRERLCKVEQCSGLSRSRCDVVKARARMVCIPLERGGRRDLLQYAAGDAGVSALGSNLGVNPDKSVDDQWVIHDAASLKEDRDCFVIREPRPVGSI